MPRLSEKMQVDSDDDFALVPAPTSAASTSTSSSSKTSRDNPRLAVLVFVHGFKGDDKTFGDYPSRLQHSISSTFGPESDVHAWVYPAFATRGELGQCVHSFGEWLTTKVAELEMATAAKSPDGKKELARVVLIGHSMGGIVVADFARSVAKRRGDSVPRKANEIWPKIVGVLAYDTPYLGVHPGTFKNSATDAWGYVQQAQAVASSVGVGWAFLNSGKANTASVGSSASSTRSTASTTSSASSKAKGKQKAANQDDTSDLTDQLAKAGKAATSNMANAGTAWQKYGYAAAGAAAFAAAAGTAWYGRQKIVDTAQNSQLWVTSHLEFVGVLFKTSELRERLEELLELDENNVQFFCFYTQLEGADRTFIILPSLASLPESYIRAQKRFTASKNFKAKSEIEAHTAMFDPDYDAVYTLGQESAIMIVRWMRSDGRKR